MIKISSLRVQGFRLLEDVEIAVEASTTLIVGRNNSGKTSLTDVVDRFLGDQIGRFRLEDFSAGTRRKFAAAKTLRDIEESSPEDVLAALPTISLTMTLSYDAADDDLGPLAPFVIDLDPDCTTAIIKLEYAPSLPSLSALLDVKIEGDGVEAAAALYKHVRQSIPKTYSIRTTAIDPTDQSNLRNFEKSSAVEAVVSVGFIKAQRTLDESRRGDTDVIGKLLGRLFRTAESLTASPADQAVAAGLKESIAGLEAEMQDDFDTQLKALLPALNSFGFPSLNDTELRPQTTIDVESLLTDNTRILYTGFDGVHLPEGYNGLGTRNLIYILLQLEAHHKAYRSKATRPASHVVFIEEPEAHLHPQMQEVFISKLTEAAKTLSSKYPDEPSWPVQFVVSTHSSHIANAAEFDAIRYFLNETTEVAGVRHTKVKDFRKGTPSITPDDRKFLHAYMTLTKCDLYFADKAILVEGATERILMPRIIKIVDEELEPEAQLARQYITTMEVGGAHAQIFYLLLEFLELKSLVITDLDAVHEVEGKWKKCPCADGTRTSNSAIKSWFENPLISLTALHAKTGEEKTKRYCRLAYQMPEVGSDHCARSYEDALILANLDVFEIAAGDDAAQLAWEHAQTFKKSEEAIRFAILEENWSVPRYIKDGLIWLSEPPPPPEAPPPVVPNPQNPAEEVA